MDSRINRLHRCHKYLLNINVNFKGKFCLIFPIQVQLSSMLLATLVRQYSYRILFVLDYEIVFCMIQD